MALVKPEELLYYTLKSGVSIQKKGTPLHLEAGPVVDIAAADEPVFGVAAMTTEDPLNPGTYLTGVPIAVIRTGVVEVPYNLSASDSDIAIGDLVGMKGANAAGYVKKFAGKTAKKLEIEQAFNVFNQQGGTGTSYANLTNCMEVKIPDLTGCKAAYFEVHFTTSGTGGVQLYDTDDSAAITGSEITTAGSLQRTSDILDALTAGHKVILQTKGDGSNAPTVLGAKIIYQYDNVAEDARVSEMSTIVGIALEAVSAPATGNKTGYLDVLLTLQPIA